MGKECGAPLSRHFCGGGYTNPLKTTALEARESNAGYTRHSRQQHIAMRAYVKLVAV